MVIESVFESENLFDSIIKKLFSGLSVYKNIKQRKKQLTLKLAEDKARIYEQLNTIDEAEWLYQKFGDGEYTDVLGLCKSASIEEIEERDWSLTPGAYVGVAPVENDGVDFEERMAEIHRELLVLHAESNDLMDTISQNMREMGI